MKLTVKCKHGHEIVLEEPEPGELSVIYVRGYLREVLLACPACKREAEGDIEDAGR